jgi:hypothetical protein
VSDLGDLSNYAGKQVRLVLEGEFRITDSGTYRVLTPARPGYTYVSIVAPTALESIELTDSPEDYEDGAVYLDEIGDFWKFVAQEDYWVTFNSETAYDFDIPVRPLEKIA